jgi:hypothetical protein
MLKTRFKKKKILFEIIEIFEKDKDFDKIFKIIDSE